MPVKVGTGSGAVDPSVLHLGGAEAQKIMVGTGSSAVEAWANFYEASGTIPEQIWWSGDKGERTIASHVMQRGATVQVVAHVIWLQVDYNSTAAYRFSIDRNGVRIATSNPTSTVSNYRHEHTVTVACAAGDVISFAANTTKFLDPWNTLSGGAWSISSV